MFVDPSMGEHEAEERSVERERGWESVRERKRK